MGSFGGGSSPLPFLLISKHSLDLGTKGQRRLLWEDLLGVRRVLGGKPRGAGSGLFSLRFVLFENKAGQPLGPCCRPLCCSHPKNGAFSYTPPERRTVTLVLRDPGAARHPCFFPEPSNPTRAQNQGLGRVPGLFIQFAKVFGQSNPRKDDASKLECEYNFSGPIRKYKKPSGEKSEFCHTASYFLPHVPPGKMTLLLHFCLFPLTYALLGLFFFNSWKKKIPPHKPVFKKKQITM